MWTFPLQCSRRDLLECRPCERVRHQATSSRLSQLFTCQRSFRRSGDRCGVRPFPASRRVDQSSTRERDSRACRGLVNSAGSRAEDFSSTRRILHQHQPRNRLLTAGGRSLWCFSDPPRRLPLAGDSLLTRWVWIGSDSSWKSQTLFGDRGRPSVVLAQRCRTAPPPDQGGLSLRKKNRPGTRPDRIFLPVGDVPTLLNLAQTGFRS